MICDGWGYNHIRATDYYNGVPASYESFPVHFGMCHYPAKTGYYDPSNPDSFLFAGGYNPSLAWKDPLYVRKQFTESAASATAMATGYKTYKTAIGMGINMDTLVNLTQVAKALGKSAGVITTVPFSHATPAGFVAHNGTRDHYQAIAYEMILDSKCDVIMGTGNPQYDNSGIFQGADWKNAIYVGDSALWQQLLTGSGSATTFLVQGKNRTVNDIDNDSIPDPWTIVETQQDFINLATGETPKRVLGCPRVYMTLQQTRPMLNGETLNSPPYITPFTPGLPSLGQMSSGALNVLDNNSHGFFLMIEGGAIDWACHANQKGRMIEELNDFNAAVNAVFDWVTTNSNWDETMLIITGDHETGFLWGGSPFTPIVDQGPGQLPGIQFNSWDHTNSLIPFFSKGCGSDLYGIFADEKDSVRGAFIQNSEIPQLIFLLWGKPEIRHPFVHPLGITDQPFPPKDNLLTISNYPNPFTVQTTISFTLKHSSSILLEVLDSRGEFVTTLTQAVLSPGQYTFPWDGCDALGNKMPSGHYLSRLQSNEGTFVGKMILGK